MSPISRKLLESSAPRAVIWIRVLVGWVFVSEGLQKFLFPAALGVGRFAKIGIPAPEIMAPIIGALEIICGALVLAGLLTRSAALLLAMNMLVAIASTKIPMLLGHGYWIFSLGATAKPGLWSFLHASRTDFSMLLGSIFLWIVGAGPQSLDFALLRRAHRADGRR
jgi:putative oxidoreductase